MNKNDENTFEIISFDVYATFGFVFLQLSESVDF